MGSKAKYKTTAENQKLVRALALSGLRDSEIAEIVGCAESTLKKHYAGELREGRKVANAKVVSALFSNAMKGNVAAQIFWCKTRLGWSEKNELAIDIPLPARIRYVEIGEVEDDTSQSGAH